VKDLHLRILRQVARRTQRELDDHDARAGDAKPAPGGRLDLARTAAQAHARVRAAQARRRHRAPVRGVPDETDVTGPPAGEA
jgi:hypothetical protein